MILNMFAERGDQEKFLKNNFSSKEKPPDVASWLKEVRSKISILLETTGGILFSLEGLQKMLFTI